MLARPDEGVRAYVVHVVLPKREEPDTGLRESKAADEGVRPTHSLTVGRDEIPRDWKTGDKATRCSWQALSPPR